MKCPKCGEEIKHLLSQSTDYSRWYIEDGELQHMQETDAWDEYLEWFCPECNEVITDNYETVLSMFGVGAQEGKKAL